MVTGVPVLAGALAIAIHVGAMLLVMGIVAVFVCEKLGLRILGRAWLNTDALWAATFVIAAGITSSADAGGDTPTGSRAGLRVVAVRASAR